MYEVCLERGTEKDLDCLPRDRFGQIISKIKELANNPRPPGCRKLAGSKSDWRVRVGPYRIIYEIDDSLCVVRIMRVRTRQDVYR